MLKGPIQTLPPNFLEGLILLAADGLGLLRSEGTPWIETRVRME